VLHLREAVARGETDIAVFNTLAGLLIESGAVSEARAVLEGAIAVHPKNSGTADNLARLLVSIPDLPEPDRLRAYRLAEAVVHETNGQDPRALETLAATLAAIGRLDDARRYNAQAAEVARAQGDGDLAVQIKARGRGYR
jgi:Flp pilus assembly protein TadD